MEVIETFSRSDCNNKEGYVELTFSTFGISSKETKNGSSKNILLCAQSY